MNTTQRVMSISEADFIRLLPLVATQHQIRMGSGWAELFDGGKHILITFTPQQEHRIGQLSLPVLKVDIKFKGYDTNQAALFWANFERCYHRGGG